MGFIVNIMGISANVMTDKELLSLVKLYLGNDYMNTVYLFSVDTCVKLSQNHELAEAMNEADIRLPAEKIMLNKKFRHSYVGIAKSYMSFLYMLRVKGLVKSIYVIGKNAKLMEKLVDVFKTQNERIDVCGQYSMDAGEDDESIVNDINSNSPDVLVLALDTPDVQNWLESNRQRINARLCVCLCDISETVIKENAAPPKIIQKLSLGRIYNDMIRRKYTENSKKERIFQALMAEYNGKKEE